MDELNAYQQLIVWVAAIVAPIYALISYLSGSITIRTPSGQRTEYNRIDNPRGFWAGLWLMIIVASIAWLLIFKVI